MSTEINISGVRDVTGTAPIASTGGTTPAISIATANTSTTGALSSTDWNTFNNKQDALTLTTTGTSGAATLVGATLNIPQYSGGGSIYGQYIFPQSSGNYINPSVTSAPNSSTFTGVANRCFAYPFVPSTTITINELRMNVTGPVASSLARILIFDNLVNVPNNKLYESSNLDCSTTGLKTATTTQTFTAGQIYWLAVHFNSTPNTTGITTTALINIKGASSMSAVYGYRVDQTFGSFPSTFGTPVDYSTGQLPALQLKIA